MKISKYSEKVRNKTLYALYIASCQIVRMDTGAVVGMRKDWPVGWNSDN